MWIKYDDKYSVSDDGQVKNNYTNELLANSDSMGYVALKLHRKTTRLHRLLGLCFLPRIDLPNLEIDHINGDRKDNRLINLRWSPRSVNQRNKPSAVNIYHYENGWVVKFAKGGKQLYRQRFQTEQEAIGARDTFKNSEEYRLSL
jgi:hypothetical protein